MAARTKRTNPPAKIACLACRASRIRCDGHRVCSNCSARDRECVYTKSNRGGPRISRKKAALTQKLPQEPVESAEIEKAGQTNFSMPSSPYNSVYSDLVFPMISPGAGLKNLDSDHIFDSIFGTGIDASESNTFAENNDEVYRLAHPYVPMSRVYGNDEDVLNGYYIYIHPYFPILPPPVAPVTADRPLVNETQDFEPSSPVSLAISAILTLIPHPDDCAPKRQESVLLRRKQAQLFAQLAMESIEIESEILASETSPAEALSSDPSSFRRDPFHPRTPIEVESVLAYLVLSIYEYSQRGNLAKMRNRASQALDAATRLGLHETPFDHSQDLFCEAKRRAWWMTYLCVLQSSIVSSTAPIITIDRNAFDTPLPSITSDSEAWSAILDAQEMILKCTQYTVSMKKALEAGSHPSVMGEKMTALDAEIDTLTTRYSWNLNYPSTTVVDSNEQVVARCFNAQAQIKLHSARIKLHRYRAFLDAPVFSKRHCDLQHTPRRISSGDSNCSCGNFLQQRPSLSPSSTRSSSSASPTTFLPSSDNSLEEYTFHDIISAKVCMKAALTITRAFEVLPYPNRSQSPSFESLCFESVPRAPRTMPAFACCAMQCSYALLMLCRKSRSMIRGSGASLAATNGLEELYTGLQRILTTMENYSIAFEAVDGMRAQIQEAFTSAKHT
ncbi:hypothetical protein K432DRAFT_437761 [Lepidopterella palustris CBS 459.81]|uniref:Zn(2)-C6 fungal-type domain-containing protein n=1 Tax=Lepidopterella palustris CBS 459.81 TaxID=1314670 RepID=A0A8E2E0B4_9PEZI|nr:hypothetical protein K432DRAFT_437761 [Lepidopterella palustris CBS 459.81]